MATYTKNQKKKIIGDAVEAENKYNSENKQLTNIEISIVSLRKDRDAQKDKTRKAAIGKNLLAQNKKKKEIKNNLKQYLAVMRLREKMNKDLSEGYQFKF